MTADPRDITIEGRLALIADNLETRAGNDPGDRRRDWTIPAILKRINNSISGGAFEAHLLGDHTDITVTGAADGDFLRYNATSEDWENQTAEISDMTDVAASPVSGEFLRGNGTNWVNEALVLADLPSIAIDDLSDATITGVGSGDLLRYSGAAWVNTTLILADLPAITLDDLSGVTITSGDSGDFLRHSGAAWVDGSIALGDLPAIVLDDLDDVIITSGDSGDFLRHDGSDWVDGAIVLGDLPAIALDDLSDVSGSPPANAVLVFVTGSWRANVATLVTKFSQLSDTFVSALSAGHHLEWDAGSGGRWINVAGPHTTPLTADWEAGDFKISMEQIDVGWAKNNTAEDPATFAMVANDTADHNKNLIFIDIDYDYNNAGAVLLAEIAAINVDMDMTMTAAIAALPKFRIFKGHLDYGAHNPVDAAFEVTVTGTGTTALFGGNMAHLLWTHAAVTGVALRSEVFGSSASASGTNMIAGIEGLADGADSYTANIIGFRGICDNVDAAANVIAVFGHPASTATTLSADKQSALGGYLGHLYMNGGSGMFVDVTAGIFDTPSAVATTHLDFVNNTGELYVENNVEIDGILYADSDIEIKGDIIFTAADAGLLYGDLFVKNQAVTMAVISSSYAQVLVFVNNSISNKATPDAAQDHITISDTGHYLVMVSSTIFNSSGVAIEVELMVKKNNGTTDFNNLHGNQAFSSGTDKQRINLSGIISLTAADTLEVWAKSTDGTSRNITVEDITLSLVMVGQ